MSSRGEDGPLRIAVVAPPWFEVPPPGYGGIEAVCAELVEALMARGHDVTLIGAGQSRTAVPFIATYDVPPTKQLGEPLPEVIHTAAVANALAGLELDVVHDHTLAGPLLARGRGVPTVVTAHGPVTGELGDYFRHLGKTVHLVAISHAQRASAPTLPWQAMVHNSVIVDSYPFQKDKDDYVLFLGRFSPDKGVHQAIEATRLTGRRLIIAAKCNEPSEIAYVEAEIKPRLGPDVEWIGEADATRKRELLAHARCLLLPLQWEEPFGLVMIEAGACGTPVVALRRGSAPELVVDGVTGLLRDTWEELPAAIEAAGAISPEVCRDHVAQEFDVTRMAEGYERAYRAAIRAAANRAAGDPANQSSPN